MKQKSFILVCVGLLSYFVSWQVMENRAPSEQYLVSLSWAEGDMNMPIKGNPSRATEAIGSYRRLESH